MILSRGLLGAVFGVLRCASLNYVIIRTHSVITVTNVHGLRLNLWKSWRQLILAHIETVVNQLQITYIFKYDVVVVVFLFPANTAIYRYNVIQKDIAGGHRRNRIAHRAGGRNYYKLSLIKGWDEDLGEEFVWIYHNNHNCVVPGHIFYPQNFVACRYHRRASVPKLTFITHVLYTLKEACLFSLNIYHCPGLHQANHESAVSMEIPLTPISPGLNVCLNYCICFSKR